MSDRQRDIHKEVLESGEGDSNQFFSLLIREHGQDENQQIILGSDNTEIAVISNQIKHSETAGPVGSRTRIIEGECHRYGCNRLRHIRLEPAGEIWVGCVACNTNNHDHDEEQLEWR